jgi:hypothetical protein
VLFGRYVVAVTKDEKGKVLKTSLTKDKEEELRVSGTLLNLKVRPDMFSLATKGAKFLGTHAVGPIGLLAPFVRLGAHKKHPCDIQSIGQLGLQISAGE